MTKRLKKCAALLLCTAFLLPLGAGRSTAQEYTAASSDREPLPRVDLTTDSGQPVTKKEYEGATLSIDLTDRYSEYTNDYTTDKGGKIEIRCRGNSTYETSDNRLGDSGKFSYKIKLETKENLLGIGKSKHWVLIANYYDVTNMRNKLTYDLSGAMGLTYTQSRWVVVYLNGKYQGLYTLCESIRIEGDRVDITDWEDRAKTIAETIARRENLSSADTKKLKDGMENDLSWVTSGKYRGYTISDYIDISDLDIKSGYLLEYDMRQDGDTSKFTTGRGVKIQLDSPKALDTNPEMFSYVKNLIADMEEALWSENFCTNEGVHYSEFVDMESLVDYFMIFHLFKNIEFGWLSIFLYIEDGIIYFGPAWDFDGSSGNQVTLFKDWMNPESWFYMGGRADWWKELCGDPYFVTRVEERWQEIKPLLDVYMESLPLWNDYISVEANRNFSHFGAPKNWYDGGSGCKSFAAEYQTFVKWLNQRIAWLDTQWSMRDPNIEGMGLQSSEKITMTLTYADGTAMAPDRLTASGAKSDALYDLSRNDALKLTVSTLHTTHRRMKIYVNGKLLLQNVLSMDNPATISIPRGVLDTTPGAVNVIYMVGVNHENNYYRASYLTVRMAKQVPKEGQIVLRIGDEYIIKNPGEKITMPVVQYHADGFDAVGWTDGLTTYKEGQVITAEKSGYFWIDWKRTDLLTEFVLEEGAALPPETTEEPPKPVTTEPPKPVTTTPAPVTTTPAPVTTTVPVTTTDPTPITTEKTTPATTPVTTPATTPAVTEKTTVPPPAPVTPTPTVSVTVPQTTPAVVDQPNDPGTDDSSAGALWIALIAIPTAVALTVVLVLILKKKQTTE